MTSGVAAQPATVYRLTEKNDIEAVTSVQCEPIPNFHNSHSLKKFTKELEKYMNRYKKQQPQLKKAKLEFAFVPSTGKACVFLRRGAPFLNGYVCVSVRPCVCLSHFNFLYGKTLPLFLRDIFSQIFSKCRIFPDIS